MAHPKPMMPLHVQEQELPYFPTSTSTPIIIQEPDQHEHSSGSQHTLVDDEFVEQGDHPLSQLDLSEDDGERPPLLYVGLAKVEQHHSPKSKKKSILKECQVAVGNCHFGFQHIAIYGYCCSSQAIWRASNAILELPLEREFTGSYPNYFLTVISFYDSWTRFVQYHLWNILAARLMNQSTVISQLKWSWHTHPRPLQHLQYYDQATSSRSPLGSFIFFFRIRHL